MGLLSMMHHKYNMTILIVTHDKQVASCEDYILNIEDGQIVS